MNLIKAYLDTPTDRVVWSVGVCPKKWKELPLIDETNIIHLSQEEITFWEMNSIKFNNKKIGPLKVKNKKISKYIEGINILNF